MKCHLGMGCSECGGIGAIWDTTDYEEMGRLMASDALPSPQTLSKGDAEKMINEFEKAFFMRCMTETDARKRAYETAKCKLIAALDTEGNDNG
jgi:hypothetical protein